MTERCSITTRSGQRCQRPMRGAGRCDRHQLLQTVSVDPIDAFMSKRGLTLNDFFPQESVPLPSGFGSFQERRATLPEFRYTVSRWRQRLDRCRTAGRMDAYLADEFCCTVLHCHPYEVFGLSWFEDVVA